MGMKIVGRERRKLRIRKRVSGTPERPRMSVFRSARHIYAQLDDPVSGRTLASVSSLRAGVLPDPGGTGKLEAAKRVGQAVAALAQAAREAGLEF